MLKLKLLTSEILFLTILIPIQSYVTPSSFRIAKANYNIISHEYISKKNYFILPLCDSKVTAPEIDEDLRTEQDISEILEVVFNEEHTKELGRKVEEAMLEDWDLKEGVTSRRPKQLPLKVNIDMWTYEAKREFGKSNFTGAMSLYRRCIEYNPCDGRPWLGMARIYWKRGRADEAEKCYKDGLYYNPRNPYLMQSWAVMMEKMGKLQPAIDLLTSAVKSNPRHAASWVALAKLHQRFGRIDEARYCLSTAVEGDSRSYVALQSWGVLESEAGEVETARDLFRRAVEVSPRSAHSLQAWATLERREGNLHVAEDLARRALQIFPDSSRIMVSLAEIHEMRGNFDAALAVYEANTAMAEKTGDAGYFQSWAMFESRRVAEEEAATTPSDLMVQQNQARVRLLFKRAVSVNKLHSASWIAWSKYEMKAGNPDIARRLLIAGVSNFPHSRNIGWFHCCLAHLARQQDDINTARACYARALESTPPHKSLRVLLEFARMETFHGDASASLRLHELGVKRFPLEDRVWDSFMELERRRQGGDVALLTERRELIQGNRQSKSSSTIRSNVDSEDDKSVWEDEWDSEAL